MPNISMPNGDVVAFPDDMPRDQIKGLISQKFPDVGKTTSKPDTFDTISDQGLQGATFGLGNRAQAGLAALVSSGINGKPISENYKTARDVGSQRLATEMQESPLTSIASNLAGGLATGGLAAGTKAGAAVTNSLRSGNLPARIAKGALAGSASGAAYGGGTAAYEKTGEGARSGAISGGLVGGAIPGVGAALSSAVEGGKNALAGAFSRSPQALNDAGGAIKSIASDAYQKMRDAGATLNRSGISKITYSVGKSLSDSGLMNKSLHGDTLSVVSDLNKDAQAGSLTLEKLDQYRQLLGQVVRKNTTKIDGANPDAFKATKAIAAIDNAVDTLGAKHLSSGGTGAIQALDEARAAWSKYSKFDRISGIIENAAGNSTKIKQGLQTFLKNDKNTRGFSGDELSALQDAANNSNGERLQKFIGTFGFDLGSIKGFGKSATAGGLTTALGGAPLAAAGTVTKQLSHYTARGKAENLLKTIEGTRTAPSINGAISPLLSAPAGGIAGEIRGNQTRQPLQMPITPQDKLPMPAVNVPQVSPQSNAQSQTPDLFSRVIQQESRGNQAAVSNKGAIGVAQIMPRTAPDAARAAGLPYDFKRLQTDPEYNAALGKAYLDKMLERYNGNEAHALIAYNWGPGNTDKWLRSGANLARLPAETRNYIQKILGA